MEKLALALPGKDPVNISPLSPNSAIQDPTIGGVLSPLLDIVFLIASFLMLFWMVWGIFEYIFAGGDKEKLGKARSRITWAIVGFSIILLAFTLQQYIKEIFPPNEVHQGGIQVVSTPIPPK